MTEPDVEAMTAALAAEETALRERLRSLENDLQAQLHGRAATRADLVDSAEREIRKVVLRLVAIERERIEANIAATL